MSIIITTQGKNAQRVDKSSFENERRLQEYIHANPESLPMYEIKENIRLLIVAREFQSGAGPIDAIGIDKDGDIYLIETKFNKNPDRRYVVAQVLDYGAALSKYSRDISQFLVLIEEKIKAKFNMPLSEKFKEYFFIESAEELTELFENIKINFSKGSFKFVILMDKISEHLKDLILFINESSEFNIYGVEFDFYKHEQFEIIIPKILGVETSRKKEFTGTGTGKRRKGDEEQFMAEAQENFKGEDFKIFERLFDFGRSVAEYSDWGPGKEDGVEFKPFKEKVSKRNLFRLSSNGKLKFNLIKKNESDANTVAYINGVEKIIKNFSWENFLRHPKPSPDKIYASIPFEAWSVVVDDLESELSKLIKKD